MRGSKENGGLVEPPIGRALERAIAGGDPAGAGIVRDLIPGYAALVHGA